MKNNEQHEQFAQESLGISNTSIYKHILNSIALKPESKVLDIGCGEGSLLKQIKEKQPSINCFGVDLIHYPAATHFELIKQNLNEKFEFEQNQMDIIISSEVIEHLENPRHFLNEIALKAKVGGRIILTTPNPYSFLSILTFWIKGHHNAFGPKDYPAHITPITPYQMKNMIKENALLELETISFINNGRIPGTGIRYSSILPFLKGKRFSDNYCVIIKRI